MTREHCHHAGELHETTLYGISNLRLGRLRRLDPFECVESEQHRPVDTTPRAVKAFSNHAGRRCATRQDVPKPNGAEHHGEKRGRNDEHFTQSLLGMSGGAEGLVQGFVPAAQLACPLDDFNPGPSGLACKSPAGGISCV